MDLTPLIDDPSLPVAGYTLGLIDQLRKDVEQRIAKLA